MRSTPRGSVTRPLARARRSRMFRAVEEEYEDFQGDPPADELEELDLDGFDDLEDDDGYGDDDEDDLADLA